MGSQGSLPAPDVDTPPAAAAPFAGGRFPASEVAPVQHSAAGQPYHQQLNPLVARYSDAFRQATGQDLRQQTNLVSALLSSRVANLQGIMQTARSVVRAPLAPGQQMITPDRPNTWVASGMTLDAAGRPQEPSATPDPVAEAVIGGGVAGLGRAALAAAGERAAAGFLPGAVDAGTGFLKAPAETGSASAAQAVGANLGMKAAKLGALYAGGTALKAVLPQPHGLRVDPGTVASAVNQPGDAGIQNGRRLEAMGIPVGAMVPGWASRLAAWATLHGYKQTTDIPTVEGLTPAQKMVAVQGVNMSGGHLPPNASDQQIIAEWARITQHPGLADQLLTMPNQIQQAATGIPYFAYEAAKTTGQALMGNTQPLQTLAGDVAHQYTPAGIAEQYHKPSNQLNFFLMYIAPLLGALSSGSGAVARTGAAGKALQDFASVDRQPVTLEGLRQPGVPAPVLENVGRPTLERGLLQRGVQVLGDKAIGKYATLGDRALARQASRLQQGVRNSFNPARSSTLADVIPAAKALGANSSNPLIEHAATLWFAQGVTPREMLAYYTKRLAGDELKPADRVATQTQVSALQEMVNRGYGDHPTPQMLAWYDAYKPQIANREAALTSMNPAVAPVIEARKGLVQDIIHTNLNGESGRGPGGEPLHPAIVAGTHLDPVYIPHTTGDEAAVYGRYMLKKGADVTPKFKQEMRKNEGTLLTSGRLAPTMKQVNANLIRTVAMQHQMLGTQIAFGLHGQHVEPGGAVEPDTPLPPGYAAYRAPTDANGNPTGLGYKPSGSGPFSPGLARMNEALQAAKQGGGTPADLARSMLLERGTVRHGDVVMPTSVTNQLTKASRSQDEFGKTMRAMEKLTLGWRGGYAAVNLGRDVMFAANDATAAGLAGVGPISFLRAMQPKYKEFGPPGTVGIAHGMTDVTNPGHLADSASPFMRMLATATNMGAWDPVRFKRMAYAVENLTTRAMHLSEQIPKADAMVAAGLEPDRIAALRSMQQSTDKALERLSAGDALGAAHQLLDMPKKIRDFGYYQQMTMGAKSRQLRVISPFYQWTMYITRMTLLTLPAKYPIRNSLLQMMGTVGNQERDRLGKLPAYMDEGGAFPLSTYYGSAQGGPSLGGSPLSSFVPGAQNHLLTGTMFNPGYLSMFANNIQSQSAGGLPTLQGLMQNLNPLGVALVTAVTGMDPTTGIKKNAGLLGWGSATPVSPLDVAKNALVGVASATPVVNIIPALLSPPSSQKSLGQRPPSIWERLIYAATKVNLRPFDFTLNQQKNLYNGLQAAKGQPPNVALKIITNAMAAETGSKQAAAINRENQILKWRQQGLLPPVAPPPGPVPGAVGGGAVGGGVVGGGTVGGGVVGGAPVG